MNRAPVIQIDLSSGVPAYRQAADALRLLLVNGELAPGDRLPPVRRLAIDLGIHFNTVAEAYRLLAAEGWIASKPGRGAVVLDREAPARPERAETAAFTRRIREMIAAMRAAGMPAAAVARELRRLAEGLET